MVTKETESLAVRVKSLTHKYVKKLDSEKDLDCLSKILLAHEDWIERRLKVEEDLKQTDIILYYKRFSSEEAGYARDEELTKYNAFISYLKEELSFIEEATEALKKNKEQFKAAYNGHHKDYRDTPNPLDEIERRINPFKVVQLTL